MKKPYGDKYPTNPQTVGEHIRKKRMEERLLQKDVASLLKVSTDTITFWENDRFPPKVIYVPRIIKFLGYNPYSIKADSLGGRIKLHRYLNGLSQKKFAKLMHVDPSTIKSWEENKFYPDTENSVRLEKFLEMVN